MTVYVLEADVAGEARALGPTELVAMTPGSPGYVQLFDGGLADMMGQTMGIEPGSTWVVHQVYVEPEHRGTGVGKRLMADVTRWADEHLLLLVLAVAPEEGCPIDVAAWYLRLGFEWGITGPEGGVMFRKPSPSNARLNP